MPFHAARSTARQRSSTFPRRYIAPAVSGVLAAMLMLAACGEHRPPDQPLDPEPPLVQQPPASQQPASEQPATSALATAFAGVSARSRLTPTAQYLEPYLTQRADLFCSLMDQGDLTKLLGEIAVPPPNPDFTGPPGDSKLETAILIAGTPLECPNQQQVADQFLATYDR